MSEKKPKDEEKPKEGEEGAPAEGAEGAEGGAKKKFSKKKLIIIASAGILLVGGAIAGIMLTGGEEAKTEEAHGKDSHGKDAGGKDAHGKPAEGGAVDEHGNPLPPAFVDLPNIVVNLSSASGRTHFVNLKIALEIANKEEAKAIEDAMPKIQDSLITYLRDIRKEDLDGSAGTERLKLELQTRFDKILGEGKVKDIFFKEIIIQ